MVDKHVLYNIIKIIAFLTILLVLVLGIQREFIPFQFQDTIQASEYSVLRVPLIRDRIPSVAQSVPLTY